MWSACGIHRQQLCWSHKTACMQAYLCKLGFARFCNIKYTAANSAEADISNPYVHLTNVSIQRRGEEYNESHGNKWPLSCLIAWLQVTCSCLYDGYRPIHAAICFLSTSAGKVSCWAQCWTPVLDVAWMKLCMPALVMRSPLELSCPLGWCTAPL